MHLDGFGDKRPHELSGGMRQRVALARALAQEADVLLMDEPFGALDAMTRDLLHDELERLWRERELTVLFVTHNVREAARLGDRVVLLTSRPGRVAAEFAVDIDRPRRIDDRPRSRRLAGEITDRLREEVRRHGRRLSASRPTPRRSTQELAGLDALELADGDRRRAGAAGSGRRPWPKLAAVALVLGVWQLVVWSGLEAGVRPARPRPRCSTELWDRPRSGEFTRRRGHRPRCSGPSSASRSPWSSARSIGAAVSRIKVLRAARRLADHRPADHAVDRLVPAGHPAVQARPRRRSCSSSSSAPRRRSPTASSPASTTSRRSCCGPGGCSAPGASACAAT